MPDDLATVATYWNASDAYVAKNALDAAGIESFVHDEHAVDWLTAVVVRGVKLRVRAEDLMRAAEVLEVPPEPPGEVEPPREERPPEPNVCPACGSAEVRRRPKLLAFGVIAALAAGFGLAFDQMEAAFFMVLAAAVFTLIAEPQVCSECGETWR